jgi:hypothetical protein
MQTKSQGDDYNVNSNPDLARCWLEEDKPHRLESSWNPSAEAKRTFEIDPASRDQLVARYNAYVGTMFSTHPMADSSVPTPTSADLKNASDGEVITRALLEFTSDLSQSVPEDMPDLVNWAEYSWAVVWICSKADRYLPWLTEAHYRYRNREEDLIDTSNFPPPERS